MPTHFIGPVTASLADFGDWSSFLSQRQHRIHQHPSLSAFRKTGYHDHNRSAFHAGKISQAGPNRRIRLSFETPDSNPPTLTTAGRADIGIRHAIWAAVVSGAMNGRSLWWEDGVAIYFPALNLPFIQKYADADLLASNFVRGG